MYLIGDPHLGREFRAHVPLDRLGDREAMMMKDFETRLNASDETTVVVGDLFDRPVVATQTLYTTLDVIISAALLRPQRKLIILAGNHDLNKATEVRGSFHILAVALERVPNVYVLLEPEVIDGVAYFPWQYEKTATEQVNELTNWYNANIAIGHWDLESMPYERTYRRRNH
jgi:DNA repair exonuclease SbcCD nuclease subunit